jgi:hypothetical protein
MQLTAQSAGDIAPLQGSILCQDQHSRCTVSIPELQKLQVVDDFVVVESSVEMPFRRVFRHTGRSLMRTPAEKLQQSLSVEKLQQVEKLEVTTG